MDSPRFYLLTAFSPLLLAPLAWAGNPQATQPDLQQILADVQAHQRQVEALREDYTFDCLETTEHIGGDGHVTRTDSEQREEFYVHGHRIGRLVKKDGQPLSAGDQQKEDDRVKALVEKAEQTPPGQRLEGPSITVGRLLELMDLRNPRRATFRGRPTIVFDFSGRRDAKTHGMVEDASKKLAGTIWIDAKDLQVAHLEVRVNDNFRIGGVLASVQKGSNFLFDQAPVDHGLWLPTGSETNMRAKVLLLKSVRERKVQHDFGFERFEVVTPDPKQVSEVSQP